MVVVWERLFACRRTRDNEKQPTVVIAQKHDNYNTIIAIAIIHSVYFISVYQSWRVYNYCRGLLFDRCFLFKVGLPL